MFVDMIRLWATKGGRDIFRIHEKRKSDEEDVDRMVRSTVDAAPPSMPEQSLSSCMLPYSKASRRANRLSTPRSLGQLFASSDTLSGEEGERLREYCSTAYMDPDKHLKDPYGLLFEDGSLTAFQEHFQGRVQHFEGRRHEAAQELFKLKWGPTRIPVYVVLLAFTTLNPGLRYNYIAIAEWLVDTAKVPVDGTDMSGTTALMHSISTKPYFDPEFAQIMLDAGGDINRRDRFGGVAAHDITTVQLLYEPDAHEKAGRALQWFLEHGGILDVEDGDGTSVRRIIANLEDTDRTLKGVVDRFEEQRADDKFPGNSTIPRPTARNSPCPCGSGRKFKKCCGKE